MKNYISYETFPYQSMNTIDLEKLIFLLEKKKNDKPKAQFTKSFNQKMTDAVKEHLQKEEYRALIRDSFGDESKRQVLREIIHSFVSSKEFLSRFSASLDDLSLDQVTDYLLEKIAGLGVLKPLADIPTVTDIKVLNWDNVWVDDIYKGPYKTNVKFESLNDFLELCNRFVFASGESWTNSRPSVNAIFPQMRINIVGFDISPKISLAIRIISKELRLSEKYMIESGYATKDMIEFLKATFVNQSHLISGETGTGKTELLRYFMKYVSDRDFIIMIEDTPETYLDELYPEKPINMWKTRENSNEEGKTFGYEYLIRQALRQNPDFILIQESRGKESLSILEAVETGHIVNTTLHSFSAIDSVRRFIDLCQKAQHHPDDYYGKRITRYFNIGIHIERIQNVRKITQIVEYMDYKNGEVVANVLFEYDRKLGKHVQKGRISDQLWNDLVNSGVNTDPIAHLHEEFHYIS